MNNLLSFDLEYWHTNEFVSNDCNIINNAPANNNTGLDLIDNKTDKNEDLIASPTSAILG